VDAERADRSSSLSLSKNRQLKTTSVPATVPMIAALATLTTAHGP
jgi:hypothetical protein